MSDKSTGSDMATHYSLHGDYKLQVRPPNRRTRPPQQYPRFLVLGPQPKDESRCRPLVSWGDIIDGAPHFEGGVHTERLAAAIAKAVQ